MRAMEIHSRFVAEAKVLLVSCGVTLQQAIALVRVMAYCYCLLLIGLSCSRGAGSPPYTYIALCYVIIRNI